MNQASISEAVRRKIAAVRGLDMAKIFATSHIKHDIGITSMEYIIILTDIAASLGIDLMMFSEQEIISAHTVGDLEQVIASKLLNKEKA